MGIGGFAAELRVHSLQNFFLADIATLKGTAYEYAPPCPPIILSARPSGAGTSARVADSNFMLAMPRAARLSQLREDGSPEITCARSRKRRRSGGQEHKIPRRVECSRSSRHLRREAISTRLLGKGQHESNDWMQLPDCLRLGQRKNWTS